jgi:hypothetical protein
MKKLALLAPICLLLILTEVDRVAAQSQCVIEGQVVNGTAEAPSESVVGVKITLYTVTVEGEEFRANATTDEAGRFRFDNLHGEQSYRLRLEYEDIAYREEVAFPQGERVLPIIATIYETTSTDEAIVVNRHHIIIDFAADTLLIQEMHIFNNTTDRIYVGEEESTLRFSLPAGATNLRFDDSQLRLDTVETDEGVASLLPVVPGQSQALFSYTVPYDGTDHTLVRKTMYPTANFDLMIANVGVQGGSERLAYQGLTAGKETSYLHFEAQDLLPNAEIEIHLSGAPLAMAQSLFPQPSIGSNLQRNSPWIALSLALLGALLPVAQVSLRGRPQRVRVAEPSRVLTLEHADRGLRAQREEALQLIADLDDAFAEGQIAEEPYQQVRKSMKRRLLDMGPRLEEDR